MRNIITNVYLASELSLEAQKKACADYNQSEDIREINFSDFLESATSTLENFFDGIKLNVSLSCGQGDGFSFSAEKWFYDNMIDFINKIISNENINNIELHEKLKQYLLLLPSGYEKIISKGTPCVHFEGNTSRYAYANMNQLEMEWLTFTLDLTLSEKFIQKLNSIELFFKRCSLVLCSHLESLGYDYINNELELSDWIELSDCNNWEYDESGHMI
jgi:hypothetical protein